MIVVLENGADFGELLESVREEFCHLLDLERRADTGNDVLALCVREELTHEFLFAGRRVTREGNTGAAVVTHVTECHHLYVDGSTPGVGDIVIAAIHVRTRVVPGAEHGLDSADELFLRVGGEVRTDLGLVLSLELVGERLQVVRGQFHVVVHALLGFHLVDELLEVLLADFHDDVGVHLNESSVAVPCPTRVLRLLCDDLNDFFVQTEVQNGVHHTGHGCTRAGTDGNEQRILLIAELLAGDLLHLADVGHDLRHDLVIDLATVFVILGARLRADGEALGYGKPDVGHFRQVCALTAEQLAHVRVTLGKQVAILFCHSCFPPNIFVCLLTGRGGSSDAETPKSPKTKP